MHRSDGIDEGVLAGGLAYRAVGTGPPLVYFPPFAPAHALTTGLSRMIELRILRRFAAAGVRVYAINRRVGLLVGTTMDDLAADYATAIRARFDHPVDILGFSTGGAIALTLAAAYPTVPCRLILASAAHHLSPVAAAACRRAAERAEAGDRRGFQAAMAPAAALSKPAQRAAAVFGWLLAPLALGRDWDPSDAVRTLQADLSIDVDARLGHVVAPTLIISGANDPSYPPAITADLARRLGNVERLLYPRTGHGVILARRFVDDVQAFLQHDHGCCRAAAS